MIKIVIKSLNEFIRKFDEYIDESIEQNKPTAYRNRLDTMYNEVMNKGQCKFTSSRTGEEVMFVKGEKR